MTVTLAQLRAVVAAVDHRSFTEAAASLRMSQSAVSHAISALERSLGGRVVHRDPPVRPTALGERMLPHARAALASVGSLEDAARTPQLTGVVRLATVTTVYRAVLPRFLRRWESRLPDVDVQVFEGDDTEMSVWMEGGMVDAAVLVDPPTIPPGARVLATDDYRAVVRRDHPFARESSISLAELLEDPLIVSSGGYEEQIRELHHQAGLPFESQRRVRELATLMTMVEKGLGVSILPSLGAGLLSNRLVMLPLTPHVERNLVLSGPQSRPWHPLVTALLEELAIP
ncbi:LysR family transcriptional regulator [Actinotalea sp.]|uniref:LysR family transcriptional regulator n=1 Tax=Actinotalea sp. TaxID=1872145 RepID=UPI00356666F5